jgi:hypothetical protein
MTTPPPLSVAKNSAINYATSTTKSTTFGFCSTNPLDGDVSGELESLFDDKYMSDWNEQHMLNNNSEQLINDGLLFSELDGFLFSELDGGDGCSYGQVDNNNTGAQPISLMFVALPTLPEPDGHTFEVVSDSVQDIETSTPVIAPVQKKRKFVPHQSNLVARQALRDVLSLLKKCRRDIEKTPEQCDGGMLHMSIKALTTTFNNAMSTPLSQCLPPLPRTIVAMTHKMRVEKVQVVRVESNSIVVEALAQKKIGHALEQWSFVFTNGEWVCGERVLFI